mgnify:CR=1 FL=1
MNMNIKLEQLQKAVDDANDFYDAAYDAYDAAADDDDYAAHDAAYDAWRKAMKELKAYKKEHGL